MSLAFDDSNYDSLLDSKQRVCLISTVHAVYSSLVTSSSCDDCSANFLSAGDCALIVSRSPPSMYWLHMILDFCVCLLFDVKLDIYLGLILQGLFTKFLLFICCAGTTKCCLLLHASSTEVTSPLSHISVCNNRIRSSTTAPPARCELISACNELLLGRLHRQLAFRSLLRELRQS